MLSIVEHGLKDENPSVYPFDELFSYFLTIQDEKVHEAVAYAMQMVMFGCQKQEICPIQLKQMRELHPVAEQSPFEIKRILFSMWAQYAILQFELWQILDFLYVTQNFQVLEDIPKFNPKPGETENKDLRNVYVRLQAIEINDWESIPPEVEFALYSIIESLDVESDGYEQILLFFTAYQRLPQPLIEERFDKTDIMTLLEEKILIPDSYITNIIIRPMRKLFKSILKAKEERKQKALLVS